MPKSDDVIEIFSLRRQLDKIDGALAPIIRRLYPDARALLVAGIEILVAVRPALALQKPEAFQIAAGERGKLDPSRVNQRAPNMLTFSIQDRQPIRIMHARPRFVCPEAASRPNVEHARERSDSSVSHDRPGEERAFDVHDGIVPGRDDKLIRAGDTYAVKKPKNCHCRSSGRRLDKPEAPEDWKLVRGRLRRIDGKPARRHSITLPRCLGPEIARPLKYGELVHEIGPVNRRVNANARETR